MPNHSKEILVVDDNEMLRQFISDVLQEEGYNVSVAKNGKEVLKIIDERHPSLIITDVLMPEVDGLEILQDLKGFENRPKIIVISGGGLIPRGTCLRLADAFGADAVLAKPFHVQELFSMIEGVMAA